MRDLNKFWRDLRARGLVGTLERPQSNALDIAPIEAAVTAIRAALEDRLPERSVPARVPEVRVPAASASAQPLPL